MKKTMLIPGFAAAAFTAALSGCVLTHPTDPYAGSGAYRAPRPADAVDAAAEHSGRSVTLEGPLTLAGAVRIALANNPEIAAQRHEWESAGAQKDFARGEALPHVAIETGYSYFLNDQRLVPPSTNGQVGVFGPNIVSGDLVVRMPLFTGGRITSEIKAAELLAKASRHQLGRSREELVFNVSSLFYSLLAQRRVLESLAFNKKALQQHLTRVDHLIAAQKAAKVDRLRTQVRLANLEQQIVEQRNILAVQHEALKNLLGLDEDDSPVRIAGALAAESPALPGSREATDRAMARREDYLAARAALEAQAKVVDAARAAQWPTVYAQGSYGGRWAAGSSEHPAGADRMEDVGQVGILADIPLFEGGQIQARIRRERAHLSAARQRLRKLGLAIRLEVRTAMLNLQSARQRVQATKTAIDQATESLRVEREKYDRGKGSVTDVLDAQSSLLLTQTNYYRALAATNIALAQYRLATGEPVK